MKFTDGNPYGVGKVTGASAEPDDDDHAVLDHLVTRAITISERLTGSAAA